MKSLLLLICFAASGIFAENSEDKAPAFVTPECVYGVINDLDSSSVKREYVPSLFVDSITCEDSGLYFNGQLNRLPLWNSPGKRGEPVTKKLVKKQFTINGPDMFCVTQSLDFVMTPASASIGRTVRLLAIGDSITAGDLRNREGKLVGTSSWWTFPVEAFSKDNIDRGKNDIRLVAVGTVNVRRGREFFYKGTNVIMDGCAEGRGSRTTAFYLRHAVHWSRADLPAAWLMLGLKTHTGREYAKTAADHNLIRETPQGRYPHDYGQAVWDKYRSNPIINKRDEPWTDSGEQHAAIDKLISYYEENPENPFFDIETVRAGHDYAFNLDCYLKRYRTLKDDGTTRLIAGKTSGSKVSDVTGSDVCRPTHVGVFLGENDRWHYPGADPEKVTDDMLTIGRLCREFNPAISVAFISHPSLGVWHPERYENRIVLKKSATMNRYKFECMNLLHGKLGKRTTQEKAGMYFLPTFFTMDPTGSSLAKFSESIDSWPPLTIGGNDSVHPGLAGHKGMGFQVYAWILHTLAL